MNLNWPAKTLIFRVLLGSLLLLGLAGRASPPPAGTAPISPPAGGFAIDGDVLANTVIPNIGDWVFLTNYPGSGGGVLSAAGVPINPTITLHFVDPYNSSADSTFSGGLKWTDNPNTWTWTTGKPSSKTDINNVLVHLTTDADGHT